MSCDMLVSAPAKINIGLRVLPVRKDGYHEIESIFQTIPIFDILQINRYYSKVSCCDVICNDLVLPKRNTLTVAYNAFCELTGVTDSIQVKLQKNIPTGAGLGGGSSDAAMLINALDKIYETHLTLDDKSKIASVVGSDVFFFLDCGLTESDYSRCAVVTGRGENVKYIQPRQDLFFLMICPDVHSSTKEAYQVVDNWYAPNWKWDGPLAVNLENVYNSLVADWSFVNSFTNPLVQRFPVIGEALQDLKDAGASYIQMSGSGSAVFGVFETSALVDSANLLLCKKWRKCFSFTSF